MISLPVEMVVAVAVADWKESLALRHTNGLRTFCLNGVVLGDYEV